MHQQESIVARLRKRAARVIAGPTLNSAADEAYYPQQQTCQIPQLSHFIELFLGQREHGVFVEIGAFDGVTFSNTWGLACKNWTGVLVEPVPEFAAQARRAHASHPNVRIVEFAVGSGEGRVELVTSGPLTSANDSLNREYEAIAWAQGHLGSTTQIVPMTTLTLLLERELSGVELDLLVVDVEGFESHVFAGYDWRRPPRMLIVELSDVHPDLTATRVEDAKLMRELQARGYAIVYKDVINTVFVRDDVWSSTLFGT